MTELQSVVTTSGTIYVFETRGERRYVCRVQATDPLRRDGEWIRLVGFLGPVRVGATMTMVLEPLAPKGQAVLTMRTTTPVRKIVNQ